MPEPEKTDGALLIARALAELGEVRDRLAASKAQTDELLRRSDLPREVREVLTAMTGQHASLADLLGALEGDQ